MEEKIIINCVKLKNIIDGIGIVQTAWGIATVGILVITFIFCVFAFTHKVNLYTKNQIQRFQKEGKYFPATCIELNNSMEYLRYFIFSYRWKHRIIRQYNHLFCGYEGRRLKQLLKPTTKCSLSYFSSFSKLNSILSVMNNKLEDIRKNHRKLYSKYGEVVWIVNNSTYYYTHEINYLQDLCSMISQKNVLLVGSAGNGKTSLLCRIAEVSVANKIPCLLINSKDINENCVEYILKRLPVLPKLRNMMSIYLKLISILLFFQRKYFYVFLDAINENDREVFINSISTLLETFSKYNRIRILLSCRSEYFDSRYKTLFSASEEEPFIFNLQETKYDDRAITKMINAYMEHFNVHGPFSFEMYEKLRNSLLLTRIFFEVNSNRDECMLEFRNAEIYKLYFEKVTSENSDINFSAVINSIAQCMFKSFQFDKISIERLHLSARELSSLRNLLDNNLIISRSIHVGVGITEREEEYVYFVFDELRDFCLSRYLLTIDESNSSTEYVLFFTNVTKLFENKMSPVEGIIKYAYHHFRTILRDDLCKKILKTFGECDVQIILDREKYGPYRKRKFNNFGFSLIFSEGENITPFEIDYIFYWVKKDYRYYWEIFWFLLSNEYSGFKPNINLAVNILMHCKNEELLEKILAFFFEDKNDEYYSYLERERRVDHLKEWLNAIKKKNGILSENLKIIITILAAYDPMESALKEYHDFIMDEGFFKRIQESGFCNSIKSLVSQFKDSITLRLTDQNAIQMIMEILNLEEYYE